MRRMDFTADERVVPPQLLPSTAQCTAEMGLTETHFWGKGQRVPEKVQLECRIFPFSHHFIGIGVSRKEGMDGSNHLAAKSVPKKTWRVGPGSSKSSSRLQQMIKTVGIKEF